MPRLGRDAGAGALFLFCGAFFGIYAWSALPLGTAFRMGPGFFPVIVGGLLALFGIVILAQALRAGIAHDIQPPVAWRAVVLVTLALVLFGISVRPLGMAPALLMASFLAAFSSRRMTVAYAATVAAALTALCSLLFGYLLDLSIPLLGDWFR